jgi:hypothetical protein
VSPFEFKLKFQNPVRIWKNVQYKTCRAWNSEDFISWEFFKLLHDFGSNLRKNFKIQKLGEATVPRPITARHRAAWVPASRQAASRSFSRAPGPPARRLASSSDHYYDRRPIYKRVHREPFYPLFLPPPPLAPPLAAAAVVYHPFFIYFLFILYILYHPFRFILESDFNTMYGTVL